MSREQRTVLIGFFILLTVLALLWAKQVEPGYFARNFLAVTYLDMQNHPITVNFRSSFPGMRTFLVILHEIIGIPMEDLAYIPLGALLRAVFYFTIIFSITRNGYAATALALMTAIYPWAGWGYSSVYVHSLGGPLFLAIVLVCLVSIRSRFQSRYFVVALFIILGIHLVDYTTEAWAVLLFFSVSALFFIRHLRQHRERVSRLSSLMIVGILGGVFLFSKNTFVAFAGKITHFDPSEAIFMYFIDSTNQAIPYGYEAAGAGLGISTYFYGIIIVPMAVYVLLRLYRASYQGRFDLTIEEHVIISMAIAGGTVQPVLYFHCRATYWGCLPSFQYQSPIIFFSRKIENCNIIYGFVVSNSWC